MSKIKIKSGCLFGLCFLAWLFVFPHNARASELKVIINEVMFNPKGGDNNPLNPETFEWIELKNISGTAQNISTWSLRAGTYYALSSLISPIPANGFVVIYEGSGTNANADFSNGNVAYLYMNKNGSQLGDSYGDVALYSSAMKNKDTIADYIDYGKITNSTNYIHAVSAGIWIADDFIIPSLENKSLELKLDAKASHSSLDWQESYIIGGTPGKENSEKPKPKVYPKDLRINELVPDPQGDDQNGEFIEIYNFSDNKVNLLGWKLKDVSGAEYVFPDVDVEKGEYKALYYKDTKITLNNSGDAISFYDPNGDLISAVDYQESEEGHTYGYSGDLWQWSRFPTPGEENIFRKDYPRGVYINEILPSPKENGEDEFIELYNSSDGNIDLADWELRDSSKTGCYIFPKNTSIESLSFLTVYRKDYKFALNDSGDETVYLFDPNADEASKVSYSDAGEDVSYNFDGENWRWSRFLTPGEENQFNNLPESKTKNDKNIYVGVWADFSANAKDLDKDNLKYTWDFGDGHKSYKKNTRHKYEKAGKYTVVLKIFDGSEDKIETFNIEVKEFPRPKIKIVSVVPNPQGADNKLEYLTIKNNSKKKVDLKGWSVATGAKTLYNHPITDNLMISPGKTAKITRKISKFNLNNKKSKIELRYPDGEVAAKVKYNKKGGVENDEVYEKTGNGWDWVAPEQIEIPVPATQILQVNATENKDLVPQETITEITENATGQTPTDSLENTEETSNSKSFENSSPDQNQSIVLGTSTEKDNHPATQAVKKHWYVKALENINLAINKIIYWFW